MPPAAGSVPSREDRTVDACQRSVPSCFLERVSTKLCQLEKAEDPVSDTVSTVLGLKCKPPVCKRTLPVTVYSVRPVRATRLHMMYRHAHRKRSNNAVACTHLERMRRALRRAGETLNLSPTASLAARGPRRAPPQPPTARRASTQRKHGRRVATSTVATAATATIASAWGALRRAGFERMSGGPFSCDLKSCPLKSVPSKAPPMPPMPHRE